MASPAPGGSTQARTDLAACDNEFGCVDSGIPVPADGTVPSTGPQLPCSLGSLQDNAYFLGTTQFGTSIMSSEFATPPC